LLDARGLQFCQEGINQFCQEGIKLFLGVKNDKAKREKMEYSLFRFADLCNVKGRLSFVESVADA